MSDQQSQQQDNQLELQEQNRRVVLSPRALKLVQIIDVLVRLTYIVVMERLTARTPRIPYHTSALSGEDWVNELLSGHPWRIQVELGVYRGTFTVLVKAMEDLNIHSSRHVSIEEQVSIFLYTMVTGLTCTHIRERFQRSSSTITK